MILGGCGLAKTQQQHGWTRPQQEQNVDVVKVILLEQRMCFSRLSVWVGAVGSTGRACHPTADLHTRVLVDSECKRRKLEHVVLDFSHFTMGEVSCCCRLVLTH